MGYEELSKKLVKKCIKKGAEGAEVYIEKQRDLRIRVRNGETETITETASHGIGFRIFLKDKMAFSHCNNFTENALDNIIDNAIKMAGHMTEDKNNILPSDTGKTEVKNLYDPGFNKIPIDKKIKMAVQIEKQALKNPKITKSAGSGFSEGETQVFLANSSGINKNYKSSYCSIGVGVVAEKGEQKSSGYEYCRRRFFSQLKPIKEIADKAAKDAYEMLDPRMVKTQKAAVIFDPDVAYAILYGILRAVNGEKVLQGASFLAKSLNKKIASDLMTIIDDGTLPGGIYSQPFDGEGVPTQKRSLVKKGILKGFMYNTITAKRAGVKSTGNASRSGYRSLPGIGSHNFYITAGSISPEDIIKNTKNGLLLKGVTGYGINPVNGNFSGGASGLWIENGKIAFPVKGLTIAGNANHMLNSIDMVGNDLDLNRGFTAPTFRIKEIQIGGE